MNKEILMIICMGAGGILGAIGGLCWKPARRFVLPLVWLACLLLAGHAIIPSILACVTLSAAFCLPYGQSTPWWLKSLVGDSYAACTLFLGFTPWQIVLAVAFIGLFWLSNKTKWVPWKVWEFIVFSGVGVIISILL